MTGWSRRALCRAVSAAALAAGCSSRKSPQTTAGGRRVVSQTVLSDEVLWALGGPARAQVVAVSALADDARYSGVAGEWPTHVQRAPLTSESLLSLTPDLVIVADFTAAETRRLVTDAGVQTLLLSGFDGFDDYRRNAAWIAEAVALADAGRELVARFDARLADVSPKVRRRPNALSFSEGNIAGAGTSFDDIVRAAGFSNLAADRGETGHRRVAIEQIVAWNPDYLVVPAGRDDAETIAADLATRPGLSATTAARAGNVVAIPSAKLYAAGDGMLDAVALLAARHPEAA